METKLEQIAAKAVKQRPKSVVREIRTPRSVGTGGGRPPPVTRWAPSNGCPYRNREMTTFFLSLRVSGSFKLVRVPLEETDGRELRRPLSLPAAVCRAVSDSGSMRRVRTRGTWFRRASGRRPGCGWRRARGIRTPGYVGQIASPAICGQDGSRARTEDHPAGLWEAGHGGRRRRRSASRGGLRRGGAGGLPRTRPLAHRALGRRLSCDAGCRPDLPVIGILPKRNLSNGQPSLHAALIAAAAPQPGEHVLHIGVGYYTAILAELVGATGRVTAIEYDAELAARATANLAQTPHVRVVHGDGTRIAFEPADVIYVNAGATRPADAWLDRLKEGGRLILPLTADAFRTATCGAGSCSGSR